MTLQAPRRTPISGEGAAGAWSIRLTPAAGRDEEHERRLLVDNRLHRRADAEEPRRAVDAGTSFRAATRTTLDAMSNLHGADGREDNMDRRGRRHAAASLLAICEISPRGRL
jgi:hypothetical protein